MSGERLIPEPAFQERRRLFVENNGRTEIFLPYVVLDAASEPLHLFVTLEKETTPLLENRLVPAEEELPALNEMLANARELRAVPESQRPRELLNLLRAKVVYSYGSTLAHLEKTDPELVDAIRKNNGSQIVQLASLREAIRYGYANCTPLSIGMLILAKEAGLAGTIVTNAPGMGKVEGADPNPIKNIIRRDIHTGLFKSDNNFGSHIPVGHAWVELKTSDGIWIPIDPSTELVGDTEEGMATFRDANYRASVASKVNMSPLPAGVRHFGMRDLEFLPGEPEHTGTLQINAVAPQEGESETTGHYEGPLAIQLIRWQLRPTSSMGVNYHIQSVVTDR